MNDSRSLDFAPNDIQFEVKAISFVPQAFIFLLQIRDCVNHFLELVKGKHLFEVRRLPYSILLFP